MDVEQPVSVIAESRVVRGPGTEPPALPIDALDELVARFGVWLARQDVAPARRRIYQAHAERFLRWQADGPDPEADRTRSRYTKLLVREGLSAADLAVVFAALSLLGRYLVIAPRAGWTRPGH
jgi:hypothetical protein